jgi:hypothetical protein
MIIRKTFPSLLITSIIISNSGFRQTEMDNCALDVEYDKQSTTREFIDEGYTNEVCVCDWPGIRPADEMRVFVFFILSVKDEGR